MNNKIYIILLAAIFQTTFLYGLEREQEGTREFVNMEKNIMLHYMQGKGFFKDGNYEEARLEFEKVLNITPDHQPTYMYLEKIENKSLEQKKLEQEKYKRLGTVLDGAEQKVERGGRVSDEEAIYKLTTQEQNKVDKYLANVSFKDMVEIQKRDVRTKTQQVKKEIEGILTKSRHDSIVQTAETEKPFLIKGFQDRKEEPKDMKEKVADVLKSQEDQDLEMLFDRTKKLEDYYDRGIMYYKQRDFFNAKKFFVEVMTIEPNYKYVQDYYDNCKTQVIMEELRERRREKIIRRGRNQSNVYEQDPVEFMAEKKALDDSLKITRMLSKEFSTRQKEERVQTRKEMIKDGIYLYRTGDFTTALEIFDEVLIKYPTSKQGQKYKRLCEQSIRERENAMLLEFDKIKGKIDAERIEPETSKDVLQKKVDQRRKDDAIYNVLDKKQLFKKAKNFFSKKNYEEAAKVFARVLVRDPYDKKAGHYLAKCKKLISINKEKALKLEEKNLLKEGLKLFKTKQYKEAAKAFWNTLKINSNNKKAQKYLKLCSRELKVDIVEVIKKEEQAKQDTRAESEIYENAKKLYRESKYKEAIPEFAKVVVLNPNHRYAGRYLARCKEKAQEIVPGEASEISQGSETGKGIQKSGKKVADTRSEEEIYEGAKKLYREAKYAEAIPEFEKVVALNSSHRYAGRYLERCREKAQVTVPSKAIRVSQSNDTEHRMQKTEEKKVAEEKQQQSVIVRLDRTIQSNKFQW